MKSILLDEKLLGLVVMTSGLVNASFSLREWQVVKMIFFAPWYGINVTTKQDELSAVTFLTTRISPLHHMNQKGANEQVSC